ncbi:hypothetical protein EVAR_32230_1 [Eumeta japonica]|uniref:Uncharacterized protein n=1 Tax=Eumeta variegata TaxID=151549 RepID=A0A4C1YMW7_EUMVA|nr:hypothetical protein EVAR_32230_1 [Eumeta japonica]
MANCVCAAGPVSDPIRISPISCDCIDKSSSCRVVTNHVCVCSLAEHLLRCALWKRYGTGDGFTPTTSNSTANRFFSIYKIAGAAAPQKSFAFTVEKCKIQTEQNVPPGFVPATEKFCYRLNRIQSPTRAPDVASHTATLSDLLLTSYFDYYVVSIDVPLEGKPSSGWNYYCLVRTNCERPRQEKPTYANCVESHKANDSKCPVFCREARVRDLKVPPQILQGIDPKHLEALMTPKEPPQPFPKQNIMKEQLSLSCSTQRPKSIITPTQEVRPALELPAETIKHLGQLLTSSASHILT